MIPTRWQIGRKIARLAARFYLFGMPLATEAVPFGLLCRLLCSVPHLVGALEEKPPPASKLGRESANSKAHDNAPARNLAGAGIGTAAEAPPHFPALGE